MKNKIIGQNLIPEIDKAYRFPFPVSEGIAQAIIQNPKIIYLVDPRGSDKNTLLFQLAAHIEQPVVVINDFTSTDDGIAIIKDALVNGYWLIINNSIDVNSATNLSPVIKSLQTTNSTHKNFRLFATITDNTYNNLEFFVNSLPPDANSLTAENETLFLSEQIDKLPFEGAAVLVRYAGEARVMAKQHTNFKTITTYDLVEFGRQIIQERWDNAGNHSEQVILDALEKTILLDRSETSKRKLTDLAYRLMIGSGPYDRMPRKVNNSIH